LRLFIFTVLFTVYLFAVDATLTVKKDVESRAKIALVDSSSQKDGKFFNILQADLKISGHFLADRRHHRGDISATLIPPHLKSKEYILRYNYATLSGAKLVVKLIRVADNREMFKKSYSLSSVVQAPFLAHKAISDINAVLGYPSISWINRYVVYSRYTGRRQSEIVLADYTFNYQKVIIRGGLNLFPKWANDNQRSIYYTSYSTLTPTLYRLNIYSGSKSKIGSSEGMIVCSDVSKGGRILVTMAPRGQSDIYEMSASGGSAKRITTFNGIDVGGKYIDNDNSIAFVSNRMGYPNIFKKSLHSSAANQLVYHGRNNNACDAFGNRIVYASREGSNRFNIYLRSGSHTRPITTSGSNQFPRFSSDGSVVMYIKQRGGRSSIGYVNLMSNQSLLFPFGKKVQSIDW
jgi:TolB protein